MLKLKHINIKRRFIIYKKYIKPTILLVAASIVLIISDIGCVIKNTTGLPCPACGISRAYFSLSSFDIRGAFYWHPLFWLTAILIIVLCYKPKLLLKGGKKTVIVLLSILAIYLIVYAVRMTMYFPDVQPMDYNDNAVMSKLFN